MNIKERILELHYEDTNEKADIKDLLLTLVTNFQLFEPCRYLSEDEEWINVVMFAIEDENITQAMAIRKNEITMFGIFNPAEISLSQVKTDSEDFYQ